LSVAAVTDMSAMPIVQDITDAWILSEGRWIDREDYLNENHVMVVHAAFAKMRGLSIGDSITLTLREMQTEAGEWIGWGHGIPLGFENWRDMPTYEVTYEIVGLFERYHFDIQASTNTRDVFVPLSTVPENFGVPFSNFSSIYFYSFMLTSTRYETKFVEEFADVISELGLELRFIEHGAVRFWGAVEPIMSSLAFNALQFSGVFVLLAMLISFIYIRQRRREFAVLRSLGNSKTKTILQLLAPVFIIWLPFVAVGSVMGWFFAHNAAEQTIDTFNELIDYATQVTELPNMLLMGLMAFAFTLVLLFVLFGVLILAGRPILVALQGDVSKRSKTKKARKHTQKKNVVIPTIVRSESIAAESKIIVPVSEKHLQKKKHLHGAIFRNIRRGIMRSPVKTPLSIGVAILFLLAVGWLGIAITQGDANVEWLWDNTIATAEIKMDEHDPFRRSMNANIHMWAVDEILDSGFVRHAYLEAGHYWSVLVPTTSYGGFPYELLDSGEIGLDDVTPIFSTSSIDEFLIENENRAGTWFGHYFDEYGVFQVRERTPLSIDFADGYNALAFSQFEFYDLNDTIVPVLLSARIADKNGLSFGDEAFITDEFFGNVARPFRVHVKVAGIYTGYVMRFQADESVILPLSVFTSMRIMLGDGRPQGYITALFEADPAINRDISLFYELLDETIHRNAAGAVPLTFVIRNIDELMFVIQRMEQNMQMLHLLYPVVIVGAFVIAMFLAILFMYQSAKKASVMRVLGTTPDRTRGMLIAEHGVPTVIGLILGMGALLIISVLDINELALINTEVVSYGLDGDATDLRPVFFALGYLSATLIGSATGAIIITAKSPLDLLQVKE